MKRKTESIQARMRKRDRADKQARKRAEKLERRAARREKKTGESK